jgi:hypothetical protein
LEETKAKTAKDALESATAALAAAEAKLAAVKNDLEKLIRRSFPELRAAERRLDDAKSAEDETAARAELKDAETNALKNDHFRALSESIAAFQAAVGQAQFRVNLLGELFFVGSC